MPVPIVAVEIAEPRPERSEELYATLLAACNDALRQGGCALADEDLHEPTESTAAVARIIWNENRARIEVLVWGKPGIEKRAREVDFAEGHPAVERWRSVGFVAGTLANPTADDDPESSADQTEKPAEVVETDRTSAILVESAEDRSTDREEKLAHATRLWFDLGAISGPGFDEGPWRIGGLVSAVYAVRSSFVQASFTYAVRPRDESGLGARWITPGLGAGYSLIDHAGVSLKLRSEIVLENTTATVSAPEGPGNDSGGNWAVGLRLGGDVGWEPVPGLAMFVGGDIAAFAGQLHVEVGGDRTATAPAFRPSLLGGARLTIPVSRKREDARASR